MEYNKISGIILDICITVHKIMYPVYEAQIISYLKLTNKKLGFLVNFNVPVLKNGFKRYVYCNLIKMQSIFHLDAVMPRETKSYILQTYSDSV